MSVTKKTVMEVSHTICSGCMMCGDICPKQAITYPLADDCFWYPSIDNNKCVHCELCYNNCPAIKECVQSGSINASGIVCVGAKTKNEELRRESTSGGIYSELAIKCIEKGSNICGAVYDENNQVRHTIGKTIGFAERVRQSKYVQSNLFGIYKGIKKLLNSHENVVFTGTPCQVEALRSYLGVEMFDSDQLLTIDFICLGIASPVVYSKYIEHLEKRYGSKAIKIHFKDKRAGWKSIGTSIQFQNGKEYFRVGSRDSYMVSYVSDALCMRECCHACPYRKIPHVSDITLGDFWGIENVNPSFDDNKGLSAVILNTTKGENAFQTVANSITYFETDADSIAKGNFTVLEPKAPHPQRMDFLHDMYKGSYSKAIKKYCSYAGLNRILIDARYIKALLNRMINQSRGEK